MNKTGLVFMGLGFELLAVILAGAFIGSTVDEYMGWKNMGFLIVTGSLFIAWVTHFVYLLRRYMNDEMKDEAARDRTGKN